MSEDKRPPKEWFYPVVEKIRREAPQVDNPEALAGWIWYHWMKPSTKKAILETIKKRRKARLGFRKVTARMLREYGMLKHDPDPKTEELIQYKKERVPVTGYRDFWLGKYALIRLLYRADGSIFPEYAIYGAKKAGLKKDFIYRGDEFNLFVYR